MIDFSIPVKPYKENLNIHLPQDFLKCTMNIISKNEDVHAPL
jgi:hypothetical protein